MTQQLLANALLGIYPREMKTYAHINSCTQTSLPDSLVCNSQKLGTTKMSRNTLKIQQGPRQNPTPQRKGKTTMPTAPGRHPTGMVL